MIKKEEDLSTDNCELIFSFSFFPGIMQQDNSEQVIIDPKLIAKHYIKTWFFLDLLSSIPLDYIFLIFNSIRGSDVSLSHICTVKKMFAVTFCNRS